MFGCVRVLMLLAAMTIFQPICGLHRTSFAEEIQRTAYIETRLEKNTVPRNGYVVFIIKAEGEYKKKGYHIYPNTFAGFTETGGFSFTRHGWNGTYITTAETHYKILSPEQTGDLILGPVHFTYRTRATAPACTVHVTEPVFPPPEPPYRSRHRSTEQTGDIFIHASVDNNTVYKGEQVTYTCEIHHTGEQEYLSQSPPASTGFKVYEMDEGSYDNIVINDRNYLRQRRSFAFFPADTGELEIGDSRARYFISDHSFEQWGAISSEAVPITVKSLPANGCPSGFKGLVGNFTVTTGIDNSHVTLGRTLVELTVTVSGKGNADVLIDPLDNDLEGFRIIDSIDNLSVSIENETVYTEKEWRYTLAPANETISRIPQVSISFFNPRTVSYETVSSTSHTISVVVDGKEESSQPDLIDHSPLEVRQEDIRFLKPDKSRLKLAPDAPYSIAGLLFLFGMPIAILSVSFSLKRSQLRLSLWNEQLAQRSRSKKAARTLDAIINDTSELSPEERAETILEIAVEILSRLDVGRHSQSENRRQTLGKDDASTARELETVIDNCRGVLFSNERTTKGFVSDQAIHLKQALDHLGRN